MCSKHTVFWRTLPQIHSFQIDSNLIPSAKIPTLSFAMPGEDLQQHGKAAFSPQ